MIPSFPFIVAAWPTKMSKQEKKERGKEAEKEKEEDKENEVETEISMIKAVLVDYCQNTSVYTLRQITEPTPYRMRRYGISLA